METLDKEIRENFIYVTQEWKVVSFCGEFEIRETQYPGLIQIIPKTNNGLLVFQKGDKELKVLKFENGIWKEIYYQVAYKKFLKYEKYMYLK